MLEITTYASFKKLMLADVYINTDKINTDKTNTKPFNIKAKPTLNIV